MYGLIWRILPGPAWLKVVESLLIVAAIVYGLFFYAYPWVATMLPEPGSTVGSGE
ncbi:hypothetical protein GCM10022198_19360 [Klugiella xanthotipulae]|uniref:Uncharacterized protein n=1 Tax=Klugiella xanthotipulae TaxID=244735 RepID=A0A543I709_9MICO|nr:hypothetical protein [Klugiella xanthotipulae]TQM66329.1 hypothetical protein FB466_1168 [Klugiella xanthotipulae]